MTESALKVGDLVWAKMKGFSPWPGKISHPNKSAKLKKPKTNKNVFCIWFFGSNNFGWIEELQLKPYDAYKEQLSKSCKTALFKDACNAIEDYIAKKASGEIVDDDQIQEDDEDEEVIGGSSPAVGNSSVSGGEDAVEEKPSIRSTGPGRKKKLSREIENGESSTKGVTPKKRRVSSLPEKKSGKLYNHTPTRKTAGVNLLDRPANITRPDAEPLNVFNVSQTLKDKNIVPSNLKFGFLGLGIMGSGMVKNLLNSGHKVCVWNRSPEKCKDFVEAGAEHGLTPSDVITAADITFACVSDPQAAKDMVFGNCGVLQEMSASKGYVEMTGTDSETSQDIAEAIGSKGGRYLEAQVQGSKTESQEGTLLILAAGERSLYDECQSPFQAMGKHAFYLGEVGNASKMNLVLQLISGVSLSALAEGMALADRAGLQQKDVMEILNLTSLACPLFRSKGNAIIDGNFPTHLPLQHMQKDLNLALGMGHQLEQPLPLAATANEVFKHARRLGYGEHDVSAIYIRARF